MVSKLLFLVFLLGVFSTAKAQSGWTPVKPPQLTILLNDKLFNNALDLCRDRITTEGYTFDSIFSVRAKTSQGQQYELALNDTLRNIHVCTVSIVASKNSASLDRYLFIATTSPIPVGKS